MISSANHSLPTTSGPSLRTEIQGVIREALDASFGECDAWMRGHDPLFSATLARHGFIGMTWPREFGGRQASNTDRLVVTEELLRSGAPVAAHWMADRQIGPAILRYGSDDLKLRYLPRITAGEITFCLGMSESESGSDLAAVRTRARTSADGFIITGRKIWTSHAHRSTHAYVLARTGTSNDKHEGLTEFIVDLSLPGVSTRPIIDLAGEHHFNEMIFDDVEVSRDDVIGQVGRGWEQVTDQLAFERGGLERVLSTYPLLKACIDHGGDAAPLGELVSRLAALRSLAFDVAEAVDAGQAPKQSAAILKYAGTMFERDVVEHARASLGVLPDPSAAGIARLLARGITSVLGATIRGGTTEVLLTIIGRGQADRRDDSDDLSAILDRALADHRDRTDTQNWQSAVELGLQGIGTSEEQGGSGGGFTDIATLARKLGEHCMPGVIVETALANRAMALAGNSVDATIGASVAVHMPLSAEPLDDGFCLNGDVANVAWSSQNIDNIVMTATTGSGEFLFAVPTSTPGFVVRTTSNLAGEARAHIEIKDMHVSTDAVIGDAADVARTRQEVLLSHSAAILGAMRRTSVLAEEHARDREQFGRPIGSFQAVGHLLATIRAELTVAQSAVDHAIRTSDSANDLNRALAAKITTARAATVVATCAHQVVGAIGITKEHPLHRSTLRLLAWRDEAVSQGAAAIQLGESASRARETGLWDWLVGDASGM